MTKFKTHQDKNIYVNREHISFIEDQNGSTDENPTTEIYFSNGQTRAVKGNQDKTFASLWPNLVNEKPAKTAKVEEPKVETKPVVKAEATKTETVVAPVVTK